MKKHYYHEPHMGKFGSADCTVKGYDKAMPVYPRALRFCISEYEQAFQYLQGASDFVGSTKIPTSCKKCPIYDTSSECNGYRGTLMCHIVWRKIWEYVK